jgi:hypothetical protein
MPVRHEASILETEYLIMCCLIKAKANLKGTVTDECAEPVCWDYFIALSITKLYCVQ